MVNAGVLAIASGLAAQALKVVIELAMRRRWRPRVFFRNGGMPSSHTATVATLAVVVGRDVGPHDPLFSLVLVFALYVVFEATGLTHQELKTLQAHLEQLRGALEGATEQGADAGPPARAGGG